MCDYCKFTYVDDRKKTNGCKSIMVIRDGTRVSEVLINRYQDYRGSNNELILDEAIEPHEGVYTVMAKHIKITYCPFCGEKL